MNKKPVLLAVREHVDAMRNDEEMELIILALCGKIENIGCCHKHRAGLLNIIYSGLLATLGFDQNFCIELLEAMEVKIKAHMDEHAHPMH